MLELKFWYQNLQKTTCSYLMFEGIYRLFATEIELKQKIRFVTCFTHAPKYKIV